jgi:manganese oxidase
MTRLASSRRTFLAGLGVATAGVTGLAACIQRPEGARATTGSSLPPLQAQPPAQPAVPVQPAAPAAAQPATAVDHPQMPGMAAAAPAPAAPANPAVAGLTKAEEMDKHHLAGIKLFPAKTAGYGNQPLAFEMDGDVKVFRVTAARVKWEVEPGKLVDAMAYNGMVPGPEIRVTEGDKVRVVLTNELGDQSTAVHFHGQRTPNKMDGVPFLTQDPVTPGQTFAYEFVAKPAGSHMYHSHHNSTEQVGSGLLGAFVVEPRDAAKRYKVDADYLMVLNDGPFGFTLNGKSFPATQPLTAKVGQKILIRYMNEGTMIHPMHLHGFPQLVTAKDGYPLPQPYSCDTLNIAPGDRWDVVVEPDEPGAWAFHCHILPHAESQTGMFGMVTALVVEK